MGAGCSSSIRRCCTSGLLSRPPSLEAITHCGWLHWNWLLQSGRKQQVHLYIPLNTSTFVLTPSPEAYIEFQSGDVLGFYVEEARDNNFDGVVVHNRQNFTSELVWYASIAPTMATSQSGDCPYSVGIDGVLSTSTRAAPVISVNIGQNCCCITSNSIDIITELPYKYIIIL